LVVEGQEALQMAAVAVAVVLLWGLLTLYLVSYYQPLLLGQRAVRHHLALF
jgi:hypothetical protein